MLLNYKLIIWDYNGTLIDDVGVSLKIVNIMLAKRNLETITLERYRDTIDIPISNQYNTLGFRFEEVDFGELAHEYNELYSQLSITAPLREGVLAALQTIKAHNVSQAVLSSSKLEVVEAGLKRLHIFEYFDEIAARTDILASGKTDVGEALFQKLHIPPEQTVLIGDMLHDFDVAQTLNCSCILLENGHTSRALLERAGTTILKSPADLIH